MVRNFHERKIRASLEAGSDLLKTLATERDRLWPSHRWPPMRFKDGLQVGAKGGHGPIRYFVEALDPGRFMRFRFTGPKGFIGWHSFEMAPLGEDGIVLRHVLDMRLEGSARLAWPLVIRWLHDACVEDALDLAQDFLEGRDPRKPRPFSPWVRMMRALKRVPTPRPACDFTLARFEAELFDPDLRRMGA